MSDENNNIQPVSIEYAPAWIATLKRGHRYDLAGEVFDVDVPRPCWDHQKNHLDEHAVLVVDTPGFNPEYDDDSDRSTRIAMFEFKPNDGNADGALTPTAPVSARMRSFDDAERQRHERLATKNAGLSDYGAPAAVEAARAAATPSHRS